MMNVPKESVQDYYGKTLNGSDDLKTNACCCDADSIPKYQRDALALIHDDIITQYYGCGSPIPPALQGKTVLDLGCGTGKDVYTAAKLAGPNGRVIGVDMTQEQLDVAQKHVNWHMDKFQYDRPNVEFLKGDIEDLESLGMIDNSVDVVISNCVINLAHDKEKVFSEIYRVLKPGGELFFSDVYSDRRVPDAIRLDPVLYGECLGGTLYFEDFRRIMAKSGFPDFGLYSAAPITVNNAAIEEKIGSVKFFSVTVRAFKLDNLEDTCEDFGQVAIYRGTLPEFPDEFKLDAGHLFPTGKAVLVCGNTASTLSDTRYASHFDVIGDRSRHFGKFGGSRLDDIGSCC